MIQKIKKFRFDRSKLQKIEALRFDRDRLQKLKALRFDRKKYMSKTSAVILLFIAAFFAGRFTAGVRQSLLPMSAGTSSRMQGNEAQQLGQELQANADAAVQDDVTQQSVQGIQANVGVAIQGDVAQQSVQELQASAGAVTLGNAAAQDIISNATEGSWGLSFQEEGKPPVANATREELAPFGAWYSQDTQEKILYLTFDCGYENGNTPAILEALKKHSVPATFFVVGNFVADNPDLVKQMIAEGHTVGNHSFHHPDMSKIADFSAFEKEIRDLENIFKETTGQDISKYYRPPQGKYSQSNLEMAQQLGYQTYFWSLAYVDWYEDKQPSKEEAFDKLLSRIHPGAIVLLHNTSATNGAILDELLTKWEEMGYRFGALGELQ